MPARKAAGNGARRPGGVRRAAVRELRRAQLIRSTIDSIATRGFADTTLANVADGAGLSRGIVNFHFQTKDQLLVDTLRYLADEYRQVWTRALEAAGDDPAQRLEAIVLADFHPSLCNRNKIAVWHAFWGEAKSRPTYLRLFGSRDRDYSHAMRDLCGAVIADGGYRLNADKAATGLGAMSDGLWLSILVNPRSMTRAGARAVMSHYLGVLFPRHFDGNAVVHGRLR